MTEAEWLECGDPDPLLEFLRGKATERKIRLVACAVSQRYAALIPDGWYEHAVRTAEEYADTHTTTPEIVAAQELASAAFRQLRSRYFPPSLHFRRSFYGGPVSAAQHVAQLLSEDAALGVPGNLVWWATASYPIGEPDNDPDDEERRRAINEEGHQAIRATLATFPPLLREVLGNPFRPMIFEPEWRTDTAVALARRMYESRDFSGLPILADALQDAGCDSADILDHCRSPGPHVRGCWVVDLVLGKE